MRPKFSSRFALVLAALGMAIGTGNIWRFPRMAATHEGGAFLIPWVIFLFTWSIPILIAEFTLGKVTGRGPIGAFAKLLGKQAAWMGAFMAFVTLMIATYYSVVCGWTLRYAFDAIMHLGDAEMIMESSEQIRVARDSAENTFSGFAETWEALAYHLASVAIGALIVWRGVQGGIEVCCKILIPLLFLMLVGGSIWALATLEGAREGLKYLFTPNWSLLASPKIWIDGLSQSAWSTGAGWGLILAYGAYARRDDDAVAINRASGFGNNSASLLAGMFIFPAVFALLGQAGMGEAGITEALKDNGDGNTGLAFTYIPFIFKSIPQVGGVATVAFFVGLFFAALSSLIALYEMGVRSLSDTGLSRTASTLIIAGVGALIGGIAAMDMDFFISMDWVWGLALVIGGLLVAWGVQIYGANRYRRDLINGMGAKRPLGLWFNTLFIYLIPIQGITLLGWWLYDAATDEGFYGEGNHPWDPTVLGNYGVGPCVIWWATALGIFLFLSPWLGKWSLHGDPEAHEFEGRAPRLWVRAPLLLIAAVPWVLFYSRKAVDQFFGDDTSKTLKEASEGTWWILGILIPLVLLGGFLRWAIFAATAADSSEPRKEQGPSIE